MFQKMSATSASSVQCHCILKSSPHMLYMFLQTWMQLLLVSGSIKTTRSLNLYFINSFSLSSTNEKARLGNCVLFVCTGTSLRTLTCTVWGSSPTTSQMQWASSSRESRCSLIRQPSQSVLTAPLGDVPPESQLNLPQTFESLSKTFVLWDLIRRT